MGLAGTEITKQAADVVIADDKWVTTVIPTFMFYKMKSNDVNC